MTFFNFLKPFFKKSPLKITVLTICIIVAGALEGIGFALFIPLIRAITSSSASLAIAGEDFIDKFFVISGLQNSLFLLLGFIVLVVAAKNVFLYYERIFTAKISVDFEANLKKSLSSTVFASDWQFYLDQKAGTLINAFGISATKSAMAFQVGAQLCAEVLNIVIYSSIGLLISWQVFTLSMLAGLLYVYFSKNIIRVSRSLGQEGVDFESQFQSNILEDFTGMKFIKGNNIEKERENILTSLIEQLKRVAFRREKYTAILDTLPESVMVCIMCLIFYFAFKFFKVPGESLLVMLMVLYRFNRRIMAVQTLRQRLINYLPAYELCDTIIHQARRFEECTGQRALTSFESEIVFNEVGFAYNSQPVLASASFRIRKNEFVAFVGKSGSGKTTILDLITGLLKSQKGAIFVDGRPIGEYDIFLWRKILGYVPQEAFLIHGAVLENIQMASPHATNVDAVEAARMAHADEFIQNLPEGYNTLVGDRGIKLSGGQRQRIALARALVRKPQILILDEATSALDYDSESMVQKAINELKGKLTIIVVAHRLKTIEKADVIHVLDHGRIVSSGTMEELEKSSDVFKHIYTKK